jgi:hypothetical protein
LNILFIKIIYFFCNLNYFCKPYFYSEINLIVEWVHYEIFSLLMKTSMTSGSINVRFEINWISESIRSKRNATLTCFLIAARIVKFHFNDNFNCWINWCSRFFTSYAMIIFITTDSSSLRIFPDIYIEVLFNRVFIM